MRMPEARRLATDGPARVSQISDAVQSVLSGAGNFYSELLPPDQFDRTPALPMVDENESEQEDDNREDDDDDVFDASPIARILENQSSVSLFSDFKHPTSNKQTNKHLFPLMLYPTIFFGR